MRAKLAGTIHQRFCRVLLNHLKFLKRLVFSLFKEKKVVIVYSVTLLPFGIIEFLIGFLSSNNNVNVMSVLIFFSSDSKNGL